MKVFISSLISGMKEERAVAKRATELLGHQAIMAEEFSARPNSPQVACLSRLREADLVVLIAGPRYGAKQASGLSATHEEVREAQGRKPILMFVNAAGADPDQAALIEEVGSWERGLFRIAFSSPEELGDYVTRAIHDYELAHATAPLDPAEMKARALSLMPAPGRDISNAVLHVAVATGPSQSVLRPAEMENPELAAALEQRALFGPPQLFARTIGTRVGLERGVLVLRQEDRRDQGAMISFWETGDVFVQLPTERSSPGMSFPAVIEEDIADALAGSIAYVAWLLSHIDPTERLTHVSIAARLSGGSAFEWRTQSEHAASPKSGVVMGFGHEGERQHPVLLTPAHQVRQALTMDAPRLVQDLLVLLRRQWKQH